MEAMRVLVAMVAPVAAAIPATPAKPDRTAALAVTVAPGVWLAHSEIRRPA